VLPSVLDNSTTARCQSEEPSCRSARSACAGRGHPVLTRRVVIQTAARLGVTPPLVALQWAAAAGTQRAADPGTGSTGHLRENLAAEHVALDDEALRELAGVGVWRS
jgi:aryl-alcohol dehydrogenase-like predicted oxidoreductase